MALEQFSLAGQTTELMAVVHKEPANAAIISGICHFELRQYDQAQSMFALALQHLPETDETYASRAALCVFMVHAVWRDRDLVMPYRSQLARIHYEKAFAYWQETHDHTSIIEHTSLLVTMCLLADRLDCAINYSWRASLLAEQACPLDLNALLSCYCQQATCMILSGQVEGAERQLQAGLDKCNAGQPEQPSGLVSGPVTGEICQLYSLMAVVCQKKAEKYRHLSAHCLKKLGG